MINLRQRRTSRDLRMEDGQFGFCFGKDEAEAVDYSDVSEASEYAADLSYQTAEEQLAWSREQWAEQKDMINEVTDVQLPLLQAQAEMAQAGMNAYLDMMQMQQEVAWENHKNAIQDRDRYERVFQPIEDDLVMEFMAYDTEGRRALEAGRAQSDVARAQDAQRKQAVMSLEGYGIDPSQTRSQALDATLRTQQAAQQAGAGNQARKQVENTGRALRAEAINIGKGMPSNVAQSYSTALNAGSGAQSAANQAQNQMNQTMGSLTNNAGAWQGASNAMGSPTSWMGSGNQSVGNWNQSLSGQNQSNIDAVTANNEASSQMWSTVGSLAGGVMGMMMAEGGEVQGPGGPEEDRVPAQLSDGEFVLPEVVIRRKGLDWAEGLIEKAERKQAESDARMEVQQQEAAGRAMALQMPQQEAPMQRAPQQGPPQGGMGPQQGGRPGMARGGYIPRKYYQDGGAVTADGGATPQPTQQPVATQQPAQQPVAAQQPAAPQQATASQYVPPAQQTRPMTKYTGRNARPMFGYSSELANEEMARANAATKDRGTLMDKLQAEIGAQSWKEKMPGWDVKEIERVDFDIAGAIAERQAAAAAETAAEQANALAIAEAEARAAEAAASQPVANSGYSYQNHMRNERIDDLWNRYSTGWGDPESGTGGTIGPNSRNKYYEAVGYSGLS